MQDLRRIDGQQGYGTPQQDGEEVERDGAEEQLGLPDVAHAGQHGVQVEGLLLGALDTGANHRDEGEEGGQREEREGVDDSGAVPVVQNPGEGQSEEQATDGGADHVGQLVDAGAPGDGVDEVLFGHQGGDHGGGGGATERSAESNAGEDRVDRPDVGDA